jgi:hypothetical protein
MCPSFFHKSGTRINPCFLSGRFFLHQEVCAYLNLYKQLVLLINLLITQAFFNEFVSYYGDRYRVDTRSVLIILHCAITYDMNIDGYSVVSCKLRQYFVYSAVAIPTL